ncbi:MAG: cardiolipin synthase [Akkermansia sp.]
MFEWINSTPVEVSWMTLTLMAYISGFIMAVYAIYYEYSPQTALAWAIALIFIPIPSIAFYLALGSGRIRRQNKGVLPSSSQQGLRQLWFNQTDDQHPCLNAIARLTGMPPCQGNRLELLQNGTSTYNSIAEAIAEAKESILIEFYIIKDDYVGRRMREMLVQKARMGVAVHLIYDEIGSHKLPLGFILRLKYAGVRITPFHGKRFWLSSILRINYRNHRKLVIVDGKQAWMGGLNVGNEYYGKRNALSWRDTFVRVQGPVVAQAFYCFVHDWYRATGIDLVPSLSCHAAPCGKQRAMMVHSAPENQRNTWLMTLLSLCSAAQQRIWLAAPYLVPNHALSSALQAAALRGVDVRIIVPHQGDHGFVHLAMLTFLQDLETSGIKVLAYTKCFMHQKVLLVDDVISWVGSANLDMRSLHLNYELGCLSVDADMAKHVKDMLLSDMKDTIHLSSDFLESLPLYDKFAARFCRLLAPIL